jgi:hypothetical protein
MRLYDGDPDLARALLTEAKWGTTAELEEASYRWRTARLADIGFPSYEDALVVYREVQPARLVAEPPPPIPEAGEIPMLPVPFAEVLGGDSLLERALAAVDDAELIATLSASLVSVLNRVLVADRVDAADVDLVRDTTARARDTVSLALDHLGGGDVMRATEPCRRSGSSIFRVGYSLAAPSRAARVLDRAGVIDPNLDAPRAAAAVLARLDREPAGGERLFRTVADLQAMEQLVADLEKPKPRGGLDRTGADAPLHPRRRPGRRWAMIDALLLAPCVKVLAALLVARLAWWVLGDFLEHVGIPFLDAGWSRDDAQAAAVIETPDREAVAHAGRWIERPAGSGSRTAPAARPSRWSGHDEQHGAIRAAHDRARRRTGMSREVRAW